MNMFKEQNQKISKDKKRKLTALQLILLSTMTIGSEPRKTLINSFLLYYALLNCFKVFFIS
jgi:hypothetical protein